MKKIISAVLFVLILSTLASSVLAAYPQHDDAYVYDEEGVLNDESKNVIKQTNDALFVDQKMRVGVCIVNDTGDEPTDSYINGVFEDWKMSGVLILIVRGADICKAVTGENLNEVLTESKLKELIKISTDEEQINSTVASSVKNVANYLKQAGSGNGQTNNAGQNGGKKTKSTFSKVLGVILKIILVVAILLVAGYVVLVVLERRQARQRREYLEERRRRMAQSGRGSYYSARPDGQNRAGAPDRAANGNYPQAGQSRQDAYGQRGGYDRQTGYGQRTGYAQRQDQAQGARSDDRFVYPDVNDGYGAVGGARASGSARNAQNVRRPSARSGASDFEREYFSRPDAGIDNNATREFKTDNSN